MEPRDLLTPEQIAEIEEIRREHQERYNTLLICQEVSILLTSILGGWEEFGHFVGPGGGPRYAHWWNRHPSGAIVDASADQFGLPGILLIPLDDPRQQWYENDTGEDDADGYWLTRYRPFDGRNPHEDASTPSHAEYPS